MNPKPLKQHKCKYCKKPFARLPDLRRHVRIHTNEKAFKCDVCGKSFNVSGNLLVHKRIHEGVKPYECQTCKKRFTQKCSLIRHERTHSGETPFACDKCDKAFSNPYHLVCHIRMHAGLRPYKCDVCGKKFSQCSGLICHKRTHTGEKHFKCDTCGRRYSQASSLANHKRIHVDEIFASDVSSKQFSKASLLEKRKTTRGKQVGRRNNSSDQIEDVSPTTKSLFDSKRRRYTRINLFKFDIRIKLTKKSYSDLRNKRKQLTNEKVFESSELLTSGKEAFCSQISNGVSSGQETQFDQEAEAKDESCGDQIDQPTPDINQEAPYQCDLCESAFASAELMISHKEEVHISQDQEMPVCHEYEDTLSNEESLCNQTFQVTPVISEKGVYQCDSCDRTFGSSDLLILHKKDLHTAQKTSNGLYEEQLKYWFDDSPICFSDEDSYIIETDQIPMDLVMSPGSTEHLASPKELHATGEQSDSELESNKDVFDNRKDEQGPAETAAQLYQSDGTLASTEILPSHDCESNKRQEQQNQLDKEHETNKESFGTMISCERETAMSPELLLHTKRQQQQSLLCNENETNNVSNNESFGSVINSEREASMSPEYVFTDTFLTTQEEETQLTNEYEYNNEPYTTTSPQRETATSNGERSSQSDFCEQEPTSTELLTSRKEELDALQTGDVLSNQPSDLSVDYNLVDSCNEESCTVKIVISEVTANHCSFPEETVVSAGPFTSCVEDSLTTQQLKDNFKDEFEEEFECQFESNKSSSWNSPEVSLSPEYPYLGDTMFSSTELSALCMEDSSVMTKMGNLRPYKLLECRLDIERETVEELLNRTHQEKPTGTEEELQCDSFCYEEQFPATECFTSNMKEIPTYSDEVFENHSKDDHEHNFATDGSSEELCKISYRSPDKHKHVGQHLNDDASDQQLKYHANSECRTGKELSCDETAPDMSQEEGNYYCDLCKCTFLSSHLLTLHKEDIHALQQADNLSSHVHEKDDRDKYGEDSREVSFANRTDHASHQEELSQFEFCGRILPSSELLHLRKELFNSTQESSDNTLFHERVDIKTEDDKKEFEDRMEPVMSIVSPKKIHECDLCESVFVTQHLLTLHKEFHTRELPRNVVPNREFDYDLDEELEATKPLGITYICADCGGEFGLPNELLVHTEMAHAT